MPDKADNKKKKKQNNNASPGVSATNSKTPEGEMKRNENQRQNPQNAR